MNLTRRQWIWLASVFGTTQLVRGQEAFAQEPLFAEVPPSASGITWVHENAISPSHYLPEALGLLHEPAIALVQRPHILFRQIFQVNQSIVRPALRRDQFVELYLHGHAVFVLRALKQKDHEESDDAANRVHHQLPGIRIVEEGTGHEPEQRH